MKTKDRRGRICSKRKDKSRIMRSSASINVAKKNCRLPKVEGRCTTAESKTAATPSSSGHKSAAARSLVKSHKSTLDKLETTDPEFFKFLKDNDADLLNFDVSDEDDDDEPSDDNASDNQSTKQRKIHLPPDELEVASDDSDFDEEATRRKSSKKEEVNEIEVTEPVEDLAEELSVTNKNKRKSKILVTLSLVSKWDKAICAQPSSGLLKQITSAFRAALQKAGAEVVSPKFRVEDTTTFNAVVRLCFLRIPPALEKLLAVKQDAKNARKTKRKSNAPKVAADETDHEPVFHVNNAPQWKHIKPIVRSYLVDLTKFLGESRNSEVIATTLKHLSQLVPYLSSMPKLAKILLKALVRVWSSSDETSCLLAFVVVLKLVRCLKEVLFEAAIRKLYVTYVNHTKLVNADTWPLLNFMQRSFAEICSLDPPQCYVIAFVYIRQLAIHLRNAILTKKQEMIQAVYNWQYLQCLYLWSRVLSSTHEDAMMKELIFPLVEITLTAARLIPAAKYYPFRFHCARVLIQISAATKKYIPIVPLAVEVLEDMKSKSKRPVDGARPLNFDCLLKLSKSQLNEISFKKEVLSQCVHVILESLHLYVNNVGFPELIVPTVIRLKRVLKEAKSPLFKDQLKTIINKLLAHANFISERRRSATMDIRDQQSVVAFESSIPIAESEFEQFYLNWKQTQERQKQHSISHKLDIVDLDVQKIPRLQTMSEASRRKLQQRKASSSSKSFKEIMEGSSGEESDSAVDDEARFLPPEKRKQRKVKFDWSDEEDDVDSDDQSESTSSDSAEHKKRPRKRAKQAESAGAAGKSASQAKQSVKEGGKKRKQKKKNAATKLATEFPPDELEDLVLSDDDS